MHLIFLTGLPRSGTTLLAEFISLHSEVYFNTNHGGTSIMEYVPDGAIPYGGSAGCLSPMCVAYVKKRHVDFARHNVSKYVSTNHSTIAIKDEAVMLNLKNIHRHCLHMSIRCSFLMTMMKLNHWQVPEFGCGNQCRKSIMVNGQRCYDISRSENVSVMQIDFHSFGDVKTWRNIESYLDLSPIAIGMRYERRLTLKRTAMPKFVVDISRLNPKGCVLERTV